MIEGGQVNTVLKKTPKEKAGLWWKTLLVLLLLLFTTLFILNIYLNSIARSQINRALNIFLVAGGTLDRAELNLSAGQIDLSGLTINSPEAFGSHPLLKLSSLHLNLNIGTLLSDKISVNELTLKGISFVLVRNTQGELSVMNLVPLSPTDEMPPTQTEKQTSFSIPPIHIETVLFNNASLMVVDQLKKEQWTGKLDFDLQIKNLAIKDLMNGDILTGKVALALNKLNLDQLEGFSKKPLFELTNLDLIVPEINTNAKRWTIKKLHLDQLSSSIESNDAGTTNLQILANSWLPATGTGTDIQQQTAPPQTLPTLFFEDIELKSIALDYLKQIKNQSWHAGFNELDIRLEDLNIELSNIQTTSLKKLNLNLKGVAVDQPPGEKVNGKVLELEQLIINSNALDLSAPALTIQQVLLSGLHSSISVQPEGKSNLDALNQILLGTTSVNKPSKTKQTLPSILVEQIEMKESSLNYRNEMITETPLTFPLNNIQVNINQLRLFDENTKAAPASVAASFQLKQPGELPLAYFGMRANVGPIGKRIPQINAQTRMTGLKLDTLGALITTTTRRALGATGLDAGAALALNAESIKLQASVFSDEGINYNAIKMQGPLNAPSVEMGAILSGVYSRVSDGLFNIGKSGVSASGDIAFGSINVAKSVGGGAISIGKNLGESLFDVGSGLVTLDKDEVLKGLDGSSIGTLSLATDSVTSAGSAATGGLKSSVGELKGTSATERWDANIPVRYDANIKHAEEALSSMEYPPITH